MDPRPDEKDALREQGQPEDEARNPIRGLPLPLSGCGTQEQEQTAHNTWNGKHQADATRRLVFTKFPCSRQFCQQSLAKISGSNPFAEASLAPEILRPFFLQVQLVESSDCNEKSQEDAREEGEHYRNQCGEENNHESENTPHDTRVGCSATTCL